MMAQAYFFKDFIGGYWGIDNYGKSELFHDLKPFLLEGCKNKAVPMVSTSIQEAVGILKNTIPKDFKVYAICSGVPDKEAVEEVRRNFPNHAIMYPGKKATFLASLRRKLQKGVPALYQLKKLFLQNFCAVMQSRLHLLPKVLFIKIHKF